MLLYNCKVTNTVGGDLCCSLSNIRASRFPHLHAVLISCSQSSRPNLLASFRKLYKSLSHIKFKVNYSLRGVRKNYVCMIPCWKIWRESIGKLIFKYFTLPKFILYIYYIMHNGSDCWNIHSFSMPLLKKIKS